MAAVEEKTVRNGLNVFEVNKVGWKFVTSKLAKSGNQFSLGQTDRH